MNSEAVALYRDAGTLFRRCGESLERSDGSMCSGIATLDFFVDSVRLVEVGDRAHR